MFTYEYGVTQMNTFVKKCKQRPYKQSEKKRHFFIMAVFVDTQCTGSPLDATTNEKSSMCSYSTLK